MKKTLSIILIILLFGLQYRLWLGDGNVFEVIELKKAIDNTQTTLDTLKNRNAYLEAEILSLKTKLEAVEERARSNLGMVKHGETFYHIIKKDEP